MPSLCRGGFRGWWGRGKSVAIGLPLLGSVFAVALSAQQSLPGRQEAGDMVPPGLATVAAPLVFTGVTVIDVQNGRQLPAQTVVIAGRRIQALGPATKVRVPKGARVVDARGKYLIPGLWDMHVHIVHHPDVGYPLLIANGVTGVRDAASDVPLATLTQWKREIAAGTRAGPRLFVAGPALDEEPINDTELPWSAHLGGIDTPDKARRVVDSLKAAGADFIKPYGMSPEIYFALAAEARRVGIPFGGHTAPGESLGTSDSGVRFFDHSRLSYPECGDEGATEEFDAQQCAAIARQLRRNDTWGVTGDGGGFPAQAYDQGRRYLPTEMFQGQDRDSSLADMRNTPAFAQPAPASIADWIAARSYVDSATNAVKRRCYVEWQRKEAAGMPILLGTDAALAHGNFGIFVPGFVVHNALADFVVCGMTPLGALQTATLNPALALHMADSLGTVAAGKLADLVLLDGDPLADIWNISKIRAVVADGRYYDRAALDALLAQAARVAARP